MFGFCRCCGWGRGYDDPPRREFREGMHHEKGEIRDHMHHGREEMREHMLHGREEFPRRRLY